MKRIMAFFVIATTSFSLCFGMDLKQKLLETNPQPMNVGRQRKDSPTKPIKYGGGCLAFEPRSPKAQENPTVDNQSRTAVTVFARRLSSCP